jgi:hypothetical protein
VRVLVTGSRTWTDTDVIERALRNSTSRARPDEVTVVHGGADGADMLAHWCAQMLGMNTEVHPADWSRYVRRAGMVRNEAMVATGADLCLAFILDHSRGASHCARAARSAGISTRIYTLTEEVHDG